MTEFRGQNDDFVDSLESHLINPESPAIWENKYDLFFSERCEALSQEIRARLIARDVDQQVQVVQTDDLDPVDLTED